MKVLFDTSVLVAALIDSHSNHVRAFPWLLKAKRGEIEGCIGTHTLAELYAILTSLPVQKNVSSADKLLTLNQSHFKRVYPALANIIEEPA